MTCTPGRTYSHTGLPLGGAFANLLCSEVVGSGDGRSPETESCDQFGQLATVLKGGQLLVEQLNETGI